MTQKSVFVIKIVSLYTDISLVINFYDTIIETNNYWKMLFGLPLDAMKACIS